MIVFCLIWLSAGLTADLIIYRLLKKVSGEKLTKKEMRLLAVHFVMGFTSLLSVISVWIKETERETEAIRRRTREE